MPPSALQTIRLDSALRELALLENDPRILEPDETLWLAWKNDVEQLAVHLSKHLLSLSQPPKHYPLQADLRGRYGGDPHPDHLDSFEEFKTIIARAETRRTAAIAAPVAIVDPPEYVLLLKFLFCLLLTCHREDPPPATDALPPVVAVNPLAPTPPAPTPPTTGAEDLFGASSVESSDDGLSWTVKNFKNVSIRSKVKGGFIIKDLVSPPKDTPIVRRFFFSMFSSDFS